MIDKRNAVLIVDDEPDIRELLSITLSRMHREPHCAEDLRTAYQLLENRQFQLCLTDLRLPDGSGIELVEKIQRLQIDLPVIVITAYGSMDVAIRAMKAGAFDFITKPVDLTHLRTLIDNASCLATNKTADQPLSDIIGESVAIQLLKQKISKVSRSQAPVYISGESGSGKELVARAIHRQSARAEAPFVALNCGAIPSELMESELFGHVKGSFTGAHQDKQGLFLAAEGGTLFLDEVADLPLEMQVKLLRALQEKSIRPVGAAKEIATNVRILCATHKNLQAEVERQHFRSDLFYRINVIEIAVPPLRERTEDIALITTAILKKLARGNQTIEPNITSGALATLRSYNFPGNVRELENILERAMALCESNHIDVGDLQLSHNAEICYTQNDLPLTKPMAVGAGGQTIKKRFTERNLTENSVCLVGGFNSTEGSLNLAEGFFDPAEGFFDPAEGSLDNHLEGVEKDIIINALEKNHWNRTLTAKELGISFRSLRYRLKKLGLDED